MKTFRETGEILVCKGKGWKPLLNVRDHLALSGIVWLNNCHSTLSTAASRNATWNCIIQRGRHLWILCKSSSLGPKSSEMDRKTVELCSLVRRVHILACFLGKTNVGFYMPKMKKTSLCDGGASVSTSWVICIHVKVPLMRRLILEFWRDICYHQDDDFSQELHVYFNKTMPNSALVTTAWLRRRRVRVLDWPACSQDRSPIENVLHIMKRRIRQREPRTVEQRLVYTKNGQKLH